MGINIKIMTLVLLTQSSCILNLWRIWNFEGSPWALSH